MLLIDIPARVEGGQRKLMFCHDGCSSALNFLLLYNQWRPEGGTLLLAFHDSLCSIFFTRSSSPRRLLTSNWMSRGGTRTSYPCQLMVSNRLAATAPYSVIPFSSTSSLTPPILSFPLSNKPPPTHY